MRKKSGGQLQPVQPRLDAKSAPVPFVGCRLWYGPSVPRGYGVLSVDGRQVYTHRAAWQQARGPIPAGLFVLHECDTPACINPDHLFLGTAKENMEDMQAKGRGHYPGASGHRNAMRRNPGLLSGERNGSAKLTRSQVDEIRARYAAGERQVELAAAFGIRQCTVSSIIRRETWAK